MRACCVAYFGPKRYVTFFSEMELTTSAGTYALKSKLHIAGVVSLLEEDDVTIQEYALQQLSAMIEFLWPEITDSLAKM